MKLPADRKVLLSERLHGIDLSTSTCDGREFEDCRFEECNFTETAFATCRFLDCTFEGCNLSLARVDGCGFSDVAFEDCKLVGVDWTTARWPNLALKSPLRFRSCILNDSSFFGLELPELVLDACKARSVDFREGSFPGARFCFSDLAGCLFNRTDLSGADFTDATDYDIDVNFNQVRGARFSRQEALRLLDHLGIELVD
ncbi:MAG: pentapeptide repeat-containing protein [Pseudomonadales bacterium]